MPATLTSLNPASARPGDAIALTGTGFVAGMLVAVESPGSTDHILANVASAASATFEAPDLLGGAAGQAAVSVILPGEDTASNALILAMRVAPDVAAAAQLVGLARLKTILGLLPDEKAQDDRLQLLIEVASGQIQRYCDRTFGVEAIVDELHDGDDSNILRLECTPIVAVTALAIDGSAVLPAEVKVYPDYIRLEEGEEYSARLRSTGRIFPRGLQNITVSYTAGYAAVPADISHACCLQVSHLLNTVTKQGVMNETNPTAGTTTAFVMADLASGVKAICNRYRRSRVGVV